eukprot:Mycagemm_TRINITY_DN10337_c1_g2::TRINITY_DN10337_c1_g2_i2::g.1074::m.1074 type:complete len:175 gc:universal TRINITY_DN10337_c1_g2_i2:1678-1154(-)
MMLRFLCHRLLIGGRGPRLCCCCFGSSCLTATPLCPRRRSALFGSTLFGSTLFSSALFSSSSSLLPLLALLLLVRHLHCHVLQLGNSLRLGLLFAHLLNHAADALLQRVDFVHGLLDTQHLGLPHRSSRGVNSYQRVQRQQLLHQVVRQGQTVLLHSVELADAGLGVVEQVLGL